MTGKKTVVITGATGFVGRHVCVHMAGLGHRVIAAQRNVALHLPGTEPVIVGDIAADIEWPKLLAGADCIIHLAGAAHRGLHLQKQDSDQINNINAKATRRLAEAAARSGVKRFVFLSSIAVNGPHTSGRRPFSADDPCAPATPYGRSKYEAELALRSVQGWAPDLAVDVIRCPVIVGRDAPGNLRLLEQMVDRRLPLPLASIRNRRAYLDVEDLARFVALRMDANNEGMSVFTLAAEGTLPTPDLIRTIARAKQTRAILLPFPVSVLRALLAAAGLHDKADGLTRDLEIDISPALATGWRPSQSIEATILKAYQS